MVTRRLEYALLVGPRAMGTRTWVVKWGVRSVSEAGLTVDLCCADINGRFLSGSCESCFDFRVVGVDSTEVNGHGFLVI